MSISSLFFSTLLQAATSLALSLLLGIVLALSLTSAGRLRELFKSFFLSWIALPSSLIALMTIVLLNSIGITHIFSFSTVVTIHALIYAPWLAVNLSEAVRSNPPMGIDSARSLGIKDFKSIFYLWRESFLQHITPLAVQVFASSALSFNVVRLLGGGNIQTLETALYDLIRWDILNQSQIYKIITLQIIISITLGLLLTLTQKRKPSLATKEVHFATSITSSIPAGAMVALITTALIYLLSTTQKAHWISLFEMPELKTTFILSLKISLVTCLTTLVISMLFIFIFRQHHKTRLALSHFGCCLSTVMISASVIFFSVFILNIPIHDIFESGWIYACLVQSIIFFPFTNSMLSPLLLTPTQSLRDAAIALGQKKWISIWMVESLRWIKGLVSIAILLMIWSMGELASLSLFFSMSDTKPLLLFIGELQSRYLFAEARCALLLLVFTSMTLFFASRTLIDLKKY